MESTIDSKIDTFTDSFSKVALTLIAKLSEIDDFLSRISSDTEMLVKIKIQLAENIKQSSAVERHINALNIRLDKLGIGGLGMPLVGAPLSPPLTSAGAPKPAISNSLGGDSLFSMPATPTTAEKDNLADLGLVPNPAKPSSLSPLPEMPKTKGAKTASVIPLPEITAKLSPLPAKPVPRAAGGSNLPFLQIKSADNAMFIIIQNLSKEINELHASEEIGKAFLRAKDLLAAQIKFHPALFDLIKYGNDYIRKKPAVNNEFRAEVQKKVEELYKKFGGA